MPKLTQEQMEDMAECFKGYDKNGDGSISCEELATVLRALGQNPTQADVTALVEQMDPNGNGKIEFREFVDCMSKQGMKSREQESDELLAAFKVFDKDGSGFITTDELRHVLTRMGERMTDKEVEDMLAEADTNGDGRISYSEFVKILTSQ